MRCRGTILNAAVLATNIAAVAYCRDVFAFSGATSWIRPTAICPFGRTRFSAVEAKGIIGAPVGLANRCAPQPRRSAISLAAVPAAIAAAMAAAARVVVVAGATGRVGGALVKELLESSRDNPDIQVVALVRDSAKAKSQLGSDVAILEADYSDVEALSATLGCLSSRSWRLFLACANSPQQASLETNLLRAAEAHECEYVVKLSTVRTVLEAKSGGPYKAHLDVEEALMMSKIRHKTILRPNLFMQMLQTGPLGVGQLLKESDACKHPFADSPISMIDCRDVAAVAAVLLQSEDTSFYNDRTLDLTGPQAITVREFLDEAVSPLRPHLALCEALPLQDLVGSMQLPDAVAAGLRSFFSVIGGTDFVTDQVQQVCGRPARAATEFVNDHPFAFLPANFLRLVGRRRGPSFRSEAFVVEADMSEAFVALQPTNVFVKVLVAGVNGGADSFRIINADANEENFPLGVEGVGRIVAVGSSVTGLRVGDTVSFVGGFSYAEYATVDAKRCIRVSARAPPAELIALRVSGLTAAVALKHTARVKAGDVVLVTAACGATGSFAVQIAKRAGATVIGTVGSPAKVEIAKELGCDRVVNYREEDLDAVLKAELPGGIDIAYDGVGGKLLRAAHDNLADGGRILVVGAISTYPHNPEPAQHGIEGLKDVMEIFRAKETIELSGGRKIIGNVWGDSFDTGAMIAERDWLHELHANGKLRALVSLEEFHGVRSISDAVEYMLSGVNVGKVWVRICD